MDDESMVCPQCGSDDIEVRWGLGEEYEADADTTVTPINSVEFRCSECGLDFTEESDEEDGDIPSFPELERYIATLYRAKLYQGTGIYSAPDIPEKKLANAMRLYPPEDDNERILGLVDYTIFGSAKEGTLLTTRGLSWKTMGEEPRYRRYGSLGEVRSDRSTTSCGLHTLDGLFIPVLPDRPLEGLAVFLNAARARANSPPETDDDQEEQQPDSPPPLPSTESWYLGHDGDRMGPYDPDTVRRLIRDGEVDASQCLAWTQGMSDWVGIHLVPLFADLAELPPPLPSDSASDPPALRPTAVEEGDMEVDEAQDMELEVRQKEEEEYERLRLQMRKVQDRADRVKVRVGEIEDAGWADTRQEMMDRLKAISVGSLLDASQAWSEADGDLLKMAEVGRLLEAVDTEIGEVERVLNERDDDSFLDGITRVYGGSEGANN